MLSTIVPRFMFGKMPSHSAMADLSLLDEHHPLSNQDRVQLILGIYAGNIMLATLGGELGYQIMANNSWTVLDISETNFVRGMAAGSATLCFMQILGMAKIADVVGTDLIPQSLATFALGMPLAAACGAVYGMVGVGMQHHLNHQAQTHFAAAAGATGNALIYALLAGSIELADRICPSTNSTSVTMLTTFMPACMYGRHISSYELEFLSYSRNLQPSGHSERVRILAALYAANILLATLGGALGYSVLHGCGWKVDKIEFSKMIESMAAGAAVLCLLNALGMMGICEMVNRRVIKQNTGVFALGVSLASVMGAIYALVGADMQQLLNTKQEISFTMLAGALGNAMAHSIMLFLLEGPECVYQSTNRQRLVEEVDSSANDPVRNTNIFNMYRTMRGSSASDYQQLADGPDTSEALPRSTLVV